ncbi:MAG: HAD family hydrolase [Gammaproteobacteria bacterium]|nr:HAD family hydrolase [Gammaproteobacteria bacterium]
MARLRVRDHQFDADLVVFDKDGTLIDFHTLWANRARTSVDSLIEHLSGDDNLRNALHEGIGYDSENHRTVTGGPVATIAISKLMVVATMVLYQAGLDWEQAESAVHASFGKTMKQPPGADEIVPLGNVRAVIEKLTTNNVHVAIATTDDRDLTEAALQHLQIDQHFKLVKCGDDDGPLKPSPQVINDIAQHFGVSNQRTAMVGDIPSDLTMARSANCGCLIGIRHGAGDNDALAAVAEIVIDSIDEIEVI